MILLTRFNDGRRILSPGRAIGLCTGMIVIPALLFTTAAGPRQKGDDSGGGGPAPSKELEAVPAGAVAPPR
ncbi:MAG: hypothetical protein M3179_03450, partial [Actinomycetota bacterium]|nr:hypothetical protein [Actinomycetota bacterium]